MFDAFEASTTCTSCAVVRRKPRLLRRHGARLLGVTIATLSAGTAWPQNESTPIDEIVVTAQRREQSLLTVPVSVTALSGEAVEKLGVQTAMDIVGRAPNFTAIDPGTAPAFTIRGLGVQDVSDGNESPVGVYFDEVYRGTRASQVTPLFDLERVEVLRGPQGTLFGRNTTGGLVHFVSRGPTDVLDGYARLQFGSFEQRLLEGAIGGPLSDTVRGRIAVQYNEDDGWQRNRGPFGGRQGKTDSLAARAMLEWQPSDALEFLLSFNTVDRNDIQVGYAFEGVLDPVSGALCSAERVRTGQCVDSDGYGGFNPDPGTVYTEHRGSDLKRHLQFHEGSLRAEWALGPQLTLTSLTSYTSTKREMLEDSDATAVGVLGGFQVSGEFDIEATQWSQELRLGADGDKLDWIAGLFYYDDDKHPIRSGSVEFRAPGVTYGTEAAVRTQSYAAFAQADYAATDSLTLTAGLRWTNDKKDLDVRTIPSFTTGPVASGAFSVDDSKLTGKLGASWTLPSDWLLYGSVSTGFKSADFNTFDLDGNVAAAAPVDPETVTSYEIGVKGAAFDGRARMGLAVFLNDQKDKQGVVATSITASRLINYGDVKIWGVELELSARPVDQLDVELSLGYQHSRIDASPDVTVTRDFSRTVYTLDGNELPGVPSLMGSALVR